MKDGMIMHENFRHWIRHGADMGFDPEGKLGGGKDAWVWNETWGKQFSVEDCAQ